MGVFGGLVCVLGGGGGGKIPILLKGSLTCFYFATLFTQRGEVW